MALSETNRRILEKRQQTQSRHRVVSETNQKIVEKQQLLANVEKLPPLPNMGTANSSAAVYNNDADSPLVNVLFKGVLGGASVNDFQEVGKAVGQGMGRSYALTGQLLNHAVTDPKNVSLDEKITPQTYFGTSERAARLGEIVFGKEEFSLKKEDEEIFSAIGLKGGSAVSLGAFTALLTAADLFTGGGVSGFRGAVKALKSTDDVAEAAKILRGMGFEEDIVKQYADVFAKTKDIETTSKALESATQLQTTTRQLPNVPLRTTDGSDVITVGGKVFSDSVDNIRTRISTKAAEVGVQVTKKADVPNLTQLRSVTEALQTAGAKVDDIIKDLDEIEATMKVEPERFGMAKIGTVSVTDTPFRIRDGEVPVQSLDEVQEITVKDGRFTKTGDVPVTQIKQEGRIAVSDGTYTKKGNVFVQGVRNGEVRDVPIDTFTIKNGDVEVRNARDSWKPIDIAKGPRYSMNPDDVTVPAYKVADEVPLPKENTPPVDVTGEFDEVTNTKKLDEVANPVREKLGMLNVNLQERYGKAAITKSKAEKFAANEKKVFFELDRYLKEVAFVAEKGGEVKGTIPDWVPLELRSLTVLENVSRHLQEGTLPASHASQEMALYTRMVDEVAKRSGVASKPVKAVDAEGAIVESMREGTRKVGSRKNPQIKSTQTVPQTAKKEDNVFEKSDPIDREIRDEVSIKEAYEEYATMPTSKMDTVEAPFGLQTELVGDISSFKGVFRDVYRNNEKFWGEQWSVVKQKLFDPFDASKGRMVAEEKETLARLHQKVVTELGIKKGSKESAAVMRLGEGEMMYADVVKEFGEAGAKKIAEATRWFRDEYDRMLTELNAVEKAMGRKLTPKRKDYFRHYREMSDGWTGAKNAFEDPGLDNLKLDKFSVRAGERTEAKTKWQSFRQIRWGKETEVDAVGGFLEYVPNFVYAKHIDPHTATFRTFINGLKKVTDGTTAPVKYIESMEKWVDDLVGHANYLDRFVEQTVPGGTRSVKVLDYVNKRAKRNAILGNLGASVSQAFNVPGGIASAGPVSSTRGILRSLGDISYADSAPWQQSAFIMERYRHSAYSDFSVGFFEHSKDAASWLITVLDEVGTKFIWNAHYDKALLQGMKESDAMKFADDMARKVVAGRGVGEVPLLQKSKVFQTVAPFQLEVMNQWWLMKDFMDEKTFGKFATLFVSYWLFNQAAEEIKGTKVGLDPLQAFYDSYQIMTEEGQLDEEGKPLDTKDKAVKAGGRVAGEVLSNVPLGTYAATLLTTATGMNAEEHEEFFGDADPVRFGNAPLLWNAVKDPLFGIMPSWGGAQMEKTIGGIRALAENQVRDKDGNVMSDLPVEPGVAGVTRNILFGQYAPNFEYRADVEKEILSLVKENEILAENEQMDLVKKNLEDLSPELQDVYKKVAREERVKEFERQKEEMRGTYDIVTALVEEKKEAEARAILSKLSREETEVYRALAKDIKSAAYDEKVEREKESIIRSTLDYAYAFGTNPVQAFEIVFKNHEIIEDTIGGSFTGVVRTRRVPEEVSEAIKKELGYKKGDSLILEHKLPLGLGGNNLRENLELVPKDQHDAWTFVENDLIRAVKAGKITWEESHELILRHKGYAGEAITREEIQAIINKE